MKIDEQLWLWRSGISVHNYEHDQCCPDFSCCNPKLLANRYERESYVDNPEKRDRFNILFLMRAVGGICRDASVLG